MTAPLPLMEEFEYYKSVREELAEQHAGMFVAIKGKDVLGLYVDYMAAARALYSTHEQGTVFIQELKPGKDGHIGTIHTPRLVALQ